MQVDTRSELRQVEPGALLSCKGCGHTIAGIERGMFFGSIDQAYREHARHCFALKRLIVINGQTHGRPTH